MQTQTTTQAGTYSAPLKTWTPADGVKVIPLALETRSHVSTEEAAAHLLRRPQTLRGWAMRENGPIRPIRVGVRLMWPVSAIREVLSAYSTRSRTPFRSDGGQHYAVMADAVPG